MTVAELIAALQNCRYPQAKVYLWVNGNRHEVAKVDDWLKDCAHVDIDAKE
jgi:NADPH-dependent ferric siderophore reductase